MNNFREILGIPNYLIRVDGTVFDQNLNTEIKKIFYKKDGVYVNYLKVGGKYKRFYTSKLLALAFIKNNNSEIDRIVGFKDGDKNNLKIENLYWTNTADYQNHLLTLKSNKITGFCPQAFSKDTFDLKNRKESLINKGFYYIPFIKRPYVCNGTGVVINELTGKTIQPFINKKGYAILIINNHIQMPIHRLVAHLFINRPKHLENMNYSSLQVNHIDGNKLNNHYTNLEWCTNSENMSHAIKNEFFGNRIKVIAKNVKTGEHVLYPSVSQCAQIFHISTSSLLKHLNSPFAGIVRNGDWVFKKQVDVDECGWVETNDNFICPFNEINRNYDVIVTDVKNNIKYIFTSIIDACKYFKISKSDLNNFRVKNGHTAPFKDLIFEKLNRD